MPRRPRHGGVGGRRAHCHGRAFEETRQFPLARLLPGGQHRDSVALALFCFCSLSLCALALLCFFSFRALQSHPSPLLSFGPRQGCFLNICYASRIVDRQEHSPEHMRLCPGRATRRSRRHLRFMTSPQSIRLKACLGQYFMCTVVDPAQRSGVCFRLPRSAASLVLTGRVVRRLIGLVVLTTDVEYSLD